MTSNKNQILIRLNEDEHLQIQRNAKFCNKTVSAYIREMALNMCILELNRDCVMEHKHEIISYKNAINQLIFTIKKTGNYTPVDLEYIFEKTDKLLELEDKFIEIYQKNNESQRKNIARIVRQIVKNNIEKEKLHN